MLCWKESDLDSSSYWSYASSVDSRSDACCLSRSGRMTVPRSEYRVEEDLDQHDGMDCAE